jgi:hypothetical protein
MNGLRSLFRLLRIPVAMAAVVALFGCESAKESILANRLPEVRLTAAPIDTTGLYYYSITMNWVGFDPDGRVDHFLYTIDPHTLPDGADTVWVRTTANEIRQTFESGLPVREGNSPTGRLLGYDYHIFLIKAVDNKGEAGPYSARAFNSFTEAPEVFLVAPPAQSFPFVVTPAVRITWRGEDRDGVFTQKPVKYKYILLTSSSVFPAELAFARPDSLRRYYENHPDGPWAGWDSTSADTTMARFTSLTPNTIVVFCVIGFDEAGAYNPIFSFGTNMTRLNIGFAGASGPRIGMFNESFNYEYTLGGICNDADRCQVVLEVPAGRRVTINWYAIPPAGSDIESYRWGLDIEDLFDYETDRNPESTDLKHWSTASASVTSATVGPFQGGEIHFFYVLAEDNNTLKSMGTVRLEVVAFDPVRPLLVVDDTRLKPTVYNSPRDTCPRLASGPWPDASEADSFLFARGGKPWKCQGGRLSNQGLFGAYDVDTLGTRNNKEVLTVKLSALARYRHVVWMVDGAGAGNNKAGTDPIDPGVALRYMGGPGRVNTLATYIRQGGKAWLNGGGAGYAVTDPWNDRNNDGGAAKVFSSVTGRNELGPGRFMYDVAKWQSSFQIGKPVAQIHRELGRFRGPPPSKYAQLPLMIENKTPASDPVSVEAPSRFRIDSPTVDIEYIRQDANFIIEDVDPSETERLESTLDTLYRVQAPTLTNPPERNPYIPGMPTYVIMTHYAGPPPDNASVTHTGFPLWWPKRVQAQALVDYVLGTIWGGAAVGLDKRPWPGNPPNAAMMRASMQAPIDRAVARPAPARNVGTGRSGSARFKQD